MNNPYVPFDQFIFRTPVFPFNFFSKNISKILDSEKNFKNLLNNKVIQEAIYLASPVLYQELIKYLQKGLSDKKENERFKYSMVRYLSRMSTRCTPFGLFAGCSVGQLSADTCIELTTLEGYQRHTRLDMNYLCSLAQHLSRSPEIKPHLRYFCNTSIYRFGDSYRYVDYFYHETRRIHRIAAVDYSEYLNKILQAASHGKKIDELAQLVTDEEVCKEEALEFIDQLIDSQLLVSEMEPSVTGHEFLFQVIQKLRYLADDNGKNEYILGTLRLLKKIDKLLKEIDQSPIGCTLYMYDNIIDTVNKLEVKFEPKYLFQTDMVKPSQSAFLKKELSNDILEAIEFLNKISFCSGETNLSRFQEAFRERYEEREMPLLQVMDNEAGIGYRQTSNAGDINLLIDDLMVPQQFGNNMNNVPWNGVQSILLNKYIEAKAANRYVVEFTDKDFEYLKGLWNDLPLTLSVMCQILQDDENGREIFMKKAGGSSAANLLGRFCHADKQIREHVLSITQKEKELNPDALFAEITHLPESRIGNILLRPVLRPYEIPYLAKSGVEKEYQIELSDLMVSIRNGKILLRSKRLNKEIIPRLSSAHNFNFHAMPVYQFLCDMQLQSGRAGVWFNWGLIANEQNWLPRVKYKKIILSPARWVIKQNEIKCFPEIKDDKALLESLNIWRQALQMPKYVVLDDGDNELFVNLENPLSIRTLFSVLKKRTSFLLEEFLFRPDTALIKNEEGMFTNEFILSFYKNNKTITDKYYEL